MARYVNASPVRGDIRDSHGPSRKRDTNEAGQTMLTICCIASEDGHGTGFQYSRAQARASPGAASGSRVMARFSWLLCAAFVPSRITCQASGRHTVMADGAHWPHPAADGLGAAAVAARRRVVLALLMIVPVHEEVPGRRCWPSSRASLLAPARRARQSLTHQNWQIVSAFNTSACH